jgi:predicted unusual protein kinase regulating ubiquinone biosynthesis (AarF/ABC1/UbiB family)
VASVLSAARGHTSREVAEQIVPTPFWEKYGLNPPGWFKSHAAEARYSKLTRAARFRLALEEAGPLYATFGQFLAGRADLLPYAYLPELRKLKLPTGSGTLPHLKGPVASLTSTLQPIHTTPGCRAFTASYQGSPVVIEVYGNTLVPVSDRSWGRFRSSLRIFNGAPEAAICQEDVLEHFREWLQVQADIERKRAILENLQDVPGDHLCRFPRIVTELQSPTCLVYEQMNGVPLDRELVSGSGTASRTLEILAEGFLEQSLLLSLIDTEFQTENFLILEEGHLGFARLPAWIPVPVEWHQDLLQYVASSASDNAPRALQMLARMSLMTQPRANEILLNHLSSLKPELKINTLTAESVTVFENYWRALAEARSRTPLFLQLFHRNVMLFGQYNQSLAPATDVAAAALWPVIGRVLRFHIRRIFTTGKTREWIINSALLSMSAARQMAITLDNVRDNTSQRPAALEALDADAREKALNRRTVSVIRSAIILLVFLFFGLLSTRSDVPFAFLNRMIALAAAGALCVSVANIK